MAGARMRWSNCDIEGGRQIRQGRMPEAMSGGSICLRRCISGGAFCRPSLPSLSRRLLGTPIYFLIQPGVLIFGYASMNHPRLCVYRPPDS